MVRVIDNLTPSPFMIRRPGETSSTTSYVSLFLFFFEATILTDLGIAAAADSTVKHNGELERRIEELELQLAFYKRAHSVAVETSDTQKIQIATLNKQISSLDAFQTDLSPLIHCVLNGDEIFFSQVFLINGFQGGLRAAQLLTKAIAEYLSTEDLQLFTRISFWVTLFVNKIQLRNTLINQNICTHEQLDAFFSGFTQTSPRFIIVDVAGEGGADAKIKEYIATYACFPQTLRMLVGGCYTRNYNGLFSGLEGDALLGKVVMLHSGSPEAVRELQRLKIPSGLEVEGLFLETQTFLGQPPRPAPLQLENFNSAPSNGGLASPQSPIRGNGRVIDLALPLHKRTYLLPHLLLALPHKYASL
ncbi:hypothetical protein E1B28_004500 [Marasmius oreades]|uniref:DUF7923 domain-containing protein n=1 Tax=Marasmius oreades TaxID=181124 RepID=A0A9P8AD15_9AGAR|nr:uncharacterized protein E1B28_004500 [Marasmius oreades]KAG7097122.1 hypothetical protein E1B28_004500 [Marasmius oreades]